MKKMRTLFIMDYSQRPGKITKEVNKGCQWVIDGEGIATVKLDGTCCLIKDGVLYKRYTLKKNRVAPDGFMPSPRIEGQTEGTITGFVPLTKHDKYHKEAFDRSDKKDGTYELIGPKFQSNPEKADCHMLIPHGSRVIEDLPRRDFDTVKAWLESHHVEGIVFHHPDGRMVKIRRKDYGFKWNV